MLSLFVADGVHVHAQCFNKLLVVLQQNAPSFRKHNN
jgi:hypothetical protein